MSERRREGISISRDGKRMRLDPKTLNEDQAEDLIHHQLQGKGTEEILFFYRGEPVVHVHPDLLEDARMLFKEGDNPHILVQELGWHLRQTRGLVFYRKPTSS